MGGFLKAEVTGYVGGSDGWRDTKTRCGGTPGCLQRVGKWGFCLLSWISGEEQVWDAGVQGPF